MTMDPHVPAASEPAASEPQPVVSTESSGQIPATATPQPTAVPAAPVFDMTSTLAVPVKKWIAYSVIAGVVALIGSLGPWVVVSAGILGGVSVNGTQGDGVITLFLALLTIAAAIVYLLKPGKLSWLPWGLIGAGAVTTLIAIITFSKMSSLGGMMSVGAGWGLFAVLLAGLATAGLGALAMMASRAAKAPTAAPPAAG